MFVTGDLTHVAGSRYIIIERDDFQGPPSSPNPPRQKKLYLLDLDEVDDATGLLKKRLLVDLLDIADPRDIGGPLPEIRGDRFSFPLQSVESVTPVDDFTLLVGLDNNYPGGNGRVPGTPDGTEDHHAALDDAAQASARGGLRSSGDDDRRRDRDGDDHG